LIGFQLSDSLSSNAFSTNPFSILNQECQDDLATCLSLNLLENGGRLPREHWQIAQIKNLLAYAKANSSFWHKRIPDSSSLSTVFKEIPILSRDQLNLQVSNEGPLSKAFSGDEISPYQSTGSTGIPVKIFTTKSNSRYSSLRSLAQYLIENRSFTPNRTFIKPADSPHLYEKGAGIKIESFDSWNGAFNTLFKSGSYKIIHFLDDVDTLINELKKHEVGYLACPDSIFSILVKHGGKDLISKLNIHMWLHHSDNLSDSSRTLMNEIGIPIRSNYSAAEVGLIAFECPQNPGYHHVAHSNVYIEENLSDVIKVFNKELKRLIVTQLHSYATPIIRYELGDYGCLHNSCPCGHDGQTLSDIYGRKKNFIKCLDGKLIPFTFYSKPINDIVDFDEIFCYQPRVDQLVIELGSKKEIPSTQLDKLVSYINRVTENQFEVVVKCLAKIDWARNPKKLPFISYVD
jgi:phenylacetate-coenzyme A ligase PaaK-like adenylate-forming protein